MSASDPEIDAGARRARVEAAGAAVRLGEADTLLAGVLDLAVARPLALDALLTVAAVQWSADVGTACVECVDRPRILLNPCFVERHCGTRERLAMLVLHELSHISLGHTRLYPRPTAAHNVAFDALINAALLAALARSGEDPEPYAALLVELYEETEAPWLVLRPPPGWPHRPDWEASSGAPQPLREIHRRLYGAPGRKRDGLLDVTYGEIMGALADAGLAGSGGADADLESARELLRRLLGGHGSTDEERRATSSGRDHHAEEQLRGVLRALGMDRGLGCIGTGNPTEVWTIERSDRDRVLEHALSGLLRRVFVEDVQSPARWTADLVPSVSPDPSHDRRAAVRREVARVLGAPVPLLFRSEISRARPERRSAIIYLDVSGSMSGLLERLHVALVPLRRLLAASVHVFSTEVFAVTRSAFAAGRVPTTGGTSVEPVLRHFAALPIPGGRGRVPPRALLLSDGYFDAPSDRAVRALSVVGRSIHVAVLGPGPLHEDAPWVAGTTRLPDLLRPGRESLR